jgi:hypothetical protein
MEGFSTTFFKKCFFTLSLFSLVVGPVTVTYAISSEPDVDTYERVTVTDVFLDMMDVYCSVVASMLNKMYAYEVEAISNVLAYVSSSLNDGPPSLVVTGTVDRQISTVGGQIKLPYIEILTSRLSEIYQPSITNSIAFTSYNPKPSDIFPVLAKISLLPISALESEMNDDQKRGMVLGVSTSSEEEVSKAQKPELPGIDQMSLGVYCGLLSLTASLDSSRCDYETLMHASAEEGVPQAAPLINPDDKATTLHRPII